MGLCKAYKPVCDCIEETGYRLQAEPSARAGDSARLGLRDPFGACTCSRFTEPECRLCVMVLHDCTATERGRLPPGGHTYQQQVHESIAAGLG